MPRTVRHLLLRIAAAPLLLGASGCSWYLEGRTATYHGEYPPWLPHILMFAVLLAGADAWAVGRLWVRARQSVARRLLWTLLIVGVPFVGFLLYFVAENDGTST